MRRACVCGHSWAAHGWRWQDDAGCVSCCPCTRYQPRPRRRWRTRKPPAPGDGAQVSPVLPRPPAPGRRFPTTRPTPRHDCGPLEQTVDAYQGGCTFIWRGDGSEWQHAHCGRTDFNLSEWERRFQES